VPGENHENQREDKDDFFMDIDEIKNQYRKEYGMEFQPEPEDAEKKSCEGVSSEPVKKSTLLEELYDWSEALVFSLIFVSVMFMFVFKIVSVVGESMLDTLHPDERIIITDLFYEPKAGDIVVINKPNFSKELLVKRIIATEGQMVDINYDTGDVLIDGKAIDEPYIREKIETRDNVPMPFTVPEGEVFVMGDNRNHSTDSRSSLIGSIDKRYVMGRAIFRIFPLSKFGGIG
jgi:signal peptidase I